MASARKLMSEKRFYVLISPNIRINDKVRGIIESYNIMYAHIVISESDDIDVNIDLEEFGTFCHIDTEINITNTIPKIKGLRYIGYVNGTDKIISSNNNNGYIGIPVPMPSIQNPGMWEVTYPHITLVAPMGSNKFNDHKELLGNTITFQMSELIKTKSTYSNSVNINGVSHHVTRLVLNGQKPFIAKQEMEEIIGSNYETFSGYPIIM